jgi:hypothetical protein
MASGALEEGRAILAALRARGITVRLDEDGQPRVGPRALVSDVDQVLLQAHREEVVAALVATSFSGTTPTGAVTPEAEFELPACPACGASDYLPLGAGWRRCWPCHHAWGPADVPKPIWPPREVEWLTSALGLDLPLSRRRRRLPSPLLRVLSVPVEGANRNVS